jgi:hypothetical protein
MRSLVATSALLTVSLVGLTAFRQDPQALQRMVATERAFAAATAEVGIRDGFLSFFAEDAVKLHAGKPPVLTSARESLLLEPMQQLPVMNRLIWEPFTGQISSDGTLGWLTGGYVSLNVARREVTSQGAYFSVWKRQPDKTYRVWLDEGISLPRIWQDASPFRVAPDPDAGAAGGADEELNAVESSVCSNREAWRARLAEAVRLHVDGMMPLVGRDAVLASPRNTGPRTGTVIRTELAASGDLGITIGGFDDPARNAGGTWVRVWKRDVTGRWRIVFQTEADRSATGRS